MLAAVEVAWLVGKRRPITDLSSEKQEQVRRAYADTEWASDYCLDVIGIYTTMEAARAAADKPGYFFVRLPVNAAYPDEPGRYGIQDFPASDASNWYQQTSPGFEQVERTEIERAHQLTHQVCASLEEVLANS